MTAAEATVDAMLGHGIDTIYALPGVQNDEPSRPCSSSRPDADRPHRTSRARLYGAGSGAGDRQTLRLRGGAGPGLLNSAAALLTAYSMNAPVLALIGEIPDGRHRATPWSLSRDPRPGRHHQPAGGSFGLDPKARAGAAAGRAAVQAMATGPPGAGLAAMRDRRLGEIGFGDPTSRRCRCARPAR